MTPTHPLIHDMLRQLDAMDQEVTDWEANFLESLLEQQRDVSPKQLAVLATMAEQYLTAELAREMRNAASAPQGDPFL